MDNTSTLNKLSYKHPKFCIYKLNKLVIYKVLGYHYAINQYKIQNTKDFSIVLASPNDIVGVWDRQAVEGLKKKHG